jgi:hypothetical protein
MSPRQRARNATLGGLLLSGALFLLFHVTFSPFVYWPQAIGFYVTMFLRGVPMASRTDFVIIGIPTNALVYASVIFCLSSLAARRKTPS